MSITHGYRIRRPNRAESARDLTARSLLPRLLAGLVSTALLAAGIVFTASAPAVAETSPPPAAVRGPNTLYAYVGPGENLDVAFGLVNNPPAEGATSVTTGRS